jgi:hypothetical protein
MISCAGQFIVGSSEGVVGGTRVSSSFREDSDQPRRWVPAACVNPCV